MYVCVCNAVTDKHIRHAVSQGCDSMRKLRVELGVAGCCGKCAPEAKALLDATLRNTGTPVQLFPARAAA
jgi:bacterioferritin-associated ferredoxin